MRRRAAIGRGRAEPGGYGAGMGRHGKPDDTVVHGLEPFNAEPPRTALAERAVTPVERFYVRNHGPVPALDADALRLTVGGLVERPLELSLAALRAGLLPLAEVAATLQCAGNRRAGLAEVRAIPGEAPWGPGATGTAIWRGVRLADLLAAAGVRAGAAHVALIGADRSEETDPPQPFGTSIPLEKAEHPEVLLAWEMNGEPLPAVHGGPLRAVVPGYIGARSVKWLQRIEPAAEPHPGYFQNVAYRLLAPDEEPGPGRGVVLGEVALNADVLEPADGATVPAGPVRVRGYAFAGGERFVTRIDVSCDAGATWRRAELLEDLGRWAWRLWQLDAELGPASTRSSCGRGTAPPRPSPRTPPRCGTRRAT